MISKVDERDGGIQKEGIEWENTETLIVEEDKEKNEEMSGMAKISSKHLKMKDAWI